MTTITALLSVPKNPLALHIAIGWARKRYSSQLTTLTIHMIEHILGIHAQQTPTSPPFTPSPDLPQTRTRLDRPLTPVQEEEGDFPCLHKPQHPDNPPYFRWHKPQLW